jgi:hypothetical protein
MQRIKLHLQNLLPHERLCKEDEIYLTNVEATLVK